MNKSVRSLTIVFASLSVLGLSACGESSLTDSVSKKTNDIVAKQADVAFDSVRQAAADAVAYGEAQATFRQAGAQAALEGGAVTLEILNAAAAERGFDLDNGTLTVKSGGLIGTACVIPTGPLNGACK